MSQATSSEAMALAFSLETGILSPSDSISWADAQIVSLKDPGFTLIELSTESNLAEAISLLNSLGSDGNAAEVSALIFGNMSREIGKGSIHPLLAMGALESMINRGYMPDPELEGEMRYFFHVGFEHNDSSIAAEFIAFLMQHSN